jgi:hypothetical protein
MLNPREIDPKHLPALQAAILKNGSKLDEHLVSSLYRRAKAAYTGTETGVPDSKVSIVKTLSSIKLPAVTVTDMETGLFIVLAQVAEGGQPLLTFGKKFCQEHGDAMRQNVATKIW